MSTLDEQNGHPFDYQDPLSGRGVITGRRTGEARTGDELRADLEALIDAEIEHANAAQDRAERCLDLHGYGCDRAECGRAAVRKSDVRGIAEFLGPATSADLLELDAVPESVAGDAATPANRRRTVTGPSGYDIVEAEDDGTRWDQEP